MLARCNGEYTAGRYPFPVYQGYVEASFNIDENASEDEISEMARQRLQQRVAHDMAMDIHLVNVSDVAVEVETG